MFLISITGKNIKALRERRGLTQAQIGEIAGVTDKAVSTWEAGSKEPRMGAVQRIADHFGLKVSELIDRPEAMTSLALEDIATPYKPNKRVPILGRISAGLPLYAEECIEGYTYVDFKDNEEYFGLIVKGDSMTAARIHEGDIVVVRRQASVDNGDISVVIVDGLDATIKRFYKSGDRITLSPQSLNPAHVVQIYDDRTDIHVLGKVVEVKFRP